MYRDMPSVVVVVGWPGSGKSSLVKSIGQGFRQRIQFVTGVPDADVFDDCDAVAIDELTHRSHDTDKMLGVLEQAAIDARKMLYLVVQNENDLKDFEFISAPLWVHTPKGGEPPKMFCEGKPFEVLSFPFPETAC